ncbi:MAG: response regulator transcription factor [Bacteroidales bacterium]|nr:response regulator transcription factor [Bacteroidales bacterium]
MSKISVGIYDEHKLVQEGLNVLLKSTKDIEVIFKACTRNQLIDSLNTTPVNVLLVNVHNVNTSFLNLMIQINISFPRVKTLILSVHDDEEVVLKIIKTGANGFLAKESERNELIEAIYTLRNGHDYYSESITHLLLKRYISKIQNEQSDGVANLKNLSSREIEIIELWGNSHTNREIADKLFISVRTVESHKNHIMQKLNLKTAVDLVKFAIKNNIIEIQ